MDEYLYDLSREWEACAIHPVGTTVYITRWEHDVLTQHGIGMMTKGKVVEYEVKNGFCTVHWERTVGKTKRLWNIGPSNPTVGS